MDQVKIGSFIKHKRREKGITQSELAEMLNITDRAISKWENGKCMPDVGVIPLLCEILNITINDLFSGEVVDMKDNKEKLEKNLLDIAKQKEESDRRLLRMEILIGFLSLLPFIIAVMITSSISINEGVGAIITLIGLVPFLIALPFMLKIEQTAGYYECKKCGNRYIPTYKSVFMATHINRTRYMKCPKCGKKSWNKKVLSTDN